MKPFILSRGWPPDFGRWRIFLPDPEADVNDRTVLSGSEGFGCFGRWPSLSFLSGLVINSLQMHLPEQRDPSLLTLMSVSLWTKNRDANLEPFPPHSLQSVWVFLSCSHAIFWHAIIIQHHPRLWEPVNTSPSNQPLISCVFCNNICLMSLHFDLL